MLDLFFKYQDALLSGLFVTLKICILVWLIGLIVWIILAFLAREFNFIRHLSHLLSFILSWIPILVLLFWLHYPFQSMLGIVIDPFITTVFCLWLVNIYMVYGIVYKTLAYVDKQYSDVARVLWNSRKKIFISIELPTVVHQNIWPLLLAQVTVMHMTLFASLISVNEIFRVAQQINAISL